MGVSTNGGFLKSNPPDELQFCSYWIDPPRLLLKHMETEYPGTPRSQNRHRAGVFPENVRKKVMPGMEDKDPLLATAEKGALRGRGGGQNGRILKKMIGRSVRMPELSISRELLAPIRYFFKFFPRRAENIRCGRLIEG